MDILLKIKNLPEKIRTAFCSNEIRFAIEQTSFMYKIREDEIKKISPLVRNVFLHELEFSKLPFELQKNLNLRSDISYGICYELNKRIFVEFEDYFIGAKSLLDQWERLKVNPIISEEKAWKMVLEIEPWILEEEKEKEEQRQKEEAEFKSRTEQLSISQVIEKSPALAELAVTNGEIKLRSLPDPVRPSIKNWISDYHDTLGAGKHSPIERGNYLFHSENGKKLNADDRQKLGMILKSLDEETPLTIDVKNEKIIFDEKNVQSSMNSQQSSANDGNQKNGEQYDIFEKYTPKKIAAYKPVSDRVNNLENFYSKYPSNVNSNQPTATSNQSSGFGSQSPVTSNRPPVIGNQISQSSAISNQANLSSVISNQLSGFGNKFPENSNKPSVNGTQPLNTQNALSKNTLSPNFATGEKITFSSPQKLPVEQTAIKQAPVNTPFGQSNPQPQIQPAPRVQMQPVQQVQPQSAPQFQPKPSPQPRPQANPFHIGPRKSMESDELTEVAQSIYNQKNVVNLKEN